MDILLSSSFNTTSKKISIVELEEPFGFLELQFVPENVALKRDMKIATLDVPQRSHDINHAYGGNDTASMSIGFYDDKKEGDNYIIRRVNWLRSLSIKPRSVRINFGDIFGKDAWLITSVNASLNDFISRNNFEPSATVITLSLKKDPVNSKTLRDARSI